MSREITILTPENVELRFELAGLGSRFLALLLDTLLQSLITLIPILVIWAAAYTAQSVSLTELTDVLSPWVIAIVILFLFSLWSGYFLFYESRSSGQTPGKKALGIKVIRDTGHPVDFRAATLRNLLRAVDALPGAYGVGILSVFISPQYRRLGDYVAGTLVVKVRQEEWIKPNEQPSADSSAHAVPSDRPEAHLPDELLVNLSQVTKDDYRAVRHFLDRRYELQAATATSLAIKLAQPLAGKLAADTAAIDDPVAFLEAIAAEWERRMVH